MQQVVGAAIVRRGAVLAARRTDSADRPGGWELPGGKVEPGEAADEALVREVAEELGCAIAVTDWLDGASPISAELELRVGLARLVEGEPTPTEHSEVSWVGPDELAGLDWLEPDRPFLEALRPLLAAAGDGPVLRGVVDDETDARAVADRLRGDGWQAHVERERFAGEDDDEDHAWAVVTDAPQVALELLVDERGGWVDPGDEGPRPGLAPPELPSAPRRVKRAGGH